MTVGLLSLKKMKKSLSFSNTFYFLLISTVLSCLILFVLIANHAAVSLQYLMIAIILLLALLTMRSVRSLLLKPLQKITETVTDGETLPAQPSKELNRLAEAYNHLHMKNAVDRQQLSYEASHDPLTGLYNRRMFESIRNNPDFSGYTLIMVDIDHFKEINDTYGHEVGDKVLQKLARILQDSFRSNDYPCRLGGDEFCVVMMRSDSRLKNLLISKIASINSRIHDTSDGLPDASLCFGIAFPDRADATDNIYNDADVALYKAKEHGNSYHIY